ncbi:hypothetical protein [Streptomyces sp. NBC_01450]|uniref:hypothetical protein n=1 Tax=Streptomyces sp. NBC_01450 TaxID=2903871 RepID=UPI003FCC421B
MKHIFAKLGINTPVELTRLAMERGGITDETAEFKPPRSWRSPRRTRWWHWGS